MEPTEIPPDVQAEIGDIEAQAWRLRPGGCLVVIFKMATGMHLTVSHIARLPTLPEIADARYLIPELRGHTMAYILPPQGFRSHAAQEFNRVHLWEIRRGVR